jgi:ketosteroid isomerase-like protein
MTFRETLDEHLAAIRARDLGRLARTLPARGPIVLITADGRLVRSADEFLSLHRDWFAGTTWRLDSEPVEVFDAADLGVAVLKLDYRDVKPSGEPLREQSYLTLVFRREGDGWVMVQDQNTPIQAR